MLIKPLRSPLSTIQGRLRSVSQLGTRWIFAMLVFAGLLVPAPQPALAATVCTQYHQVKSGETLYRIGLRYGISWRKLAKQNSIASPNRIYVGQKICVAWEEQSGTTPAAKVPTFSITAVVRDDSVTIKTADFPAQDSFQVLIGAYGTLGVNGTKVDTLKTGTGGSLSATFKIPAALKGSSRIAIRLQSATSGYYSYNWFYNNTTP